MHIIDNHISDIISAYKQIQAAENELQRKWREPLLSVYTRQREAYENDINEYNIRRAELNRRIRLGIWLSSALLLLGILVFPGLILINELGDFRGPLFCFSPLLILGGLTGWAIIILFWIWQRNPDLPNPPQDPLKSDLFDSLTVDWKGGLLGDLPKKKPHPGATGEYHFITRLQSLGAEAYILYGIQLRPGEEIDVILVGSKGVWVFEVKYLKGLIRWRDGIWTQIQSTQRLRQSSNPGPQEVGQPYEEQWQKAVDDVSTTLQRFAPDLLKRSPNITQVRGGIVFSHPKARYDIPPGCPFNWGIVSFWIDKIKSIPAQDFMDDYAVMKILDALLIQHHLIIDVKEPRSMIAYANSIVTHREEKIKRWIETN